MTMQTDTVAVEQIDREAAATFYGAHLSRPNEVPVTAHMRAGKIDDSPLIQSFARHRLAAIQHPGEIGAKNAQNGGLDGATVEACAKVAERQAAWDRGQIEGSKTQREVIAHTNAAHACETVASALRALPIAAGEGEKDCTCHPDDRPVGPCRRRYAASECQSDALRSTAEAEEIASTADRLARRMGGRFVPNAAEAGEEAKHWTLRKFVIHPNGQTLEDALLDGLDAEPHDEMAGTVYAAFYRLAAFVASSPPADLAECLRRLVDVARSTHDNVLKYERDGIGVQFTGLAMACDDAAALLSKLGAK
jgi:hypothetical protein